MEQAPSRASSKVVAARRRAHRVKRALVASAVALFALFGVAARAAHPGHSSSARTATAAKTTRLSTPADFVSALSQSQSEEFGQGGVVAPAAGPPVASTSTS